MSRINFRVSTDKKGRIIWCCPKCNKTLKTFYNTCETIRDKVTCECGEIVYFVENKQGNNLKEAVIDDFNFKTSQKKWNEN